VVGRGMGLLKQTGRLKCGVIVRTLAQHHIPGSSSRFRVKITGDARAMLNLGCGTRTHCSWNNVDFSIYARLKRYPTLSRLMHGVGLLSAERYERLQEIDPDIVAWDLRRGIPFENEVFDAVYHSHLLEHLDRRYAPLFLGECLRVLKKGGVLRVVVPDLEIRVNRYVQLLPRLQEGLSESNDGLYSEAVAELFDQMVRGYGAGTEGQKPWVSFVEKLVRGDAEKTGERHRWMYDRYSVTALLTRVGFHRVTTMSPTESRIPAWASFYLDADWDGRVFHPDSLYVEGLRE